MYNTNNVYNPYNNTEKSNKFIKLGLAIVGIFIVVAIVVFYITIWNAKTFVVTFMDTDGVYQIDAGVKRNGRVLEPQVESKEGYEFLGWYLDDILYDFNQPVTSDIYLNTKWFKTDTYEVIEISKEEQEEIKVEQEAAKQSGTIKSKTSEEIKQEQKNPSTTTKPTTSPTATSSTKPTTSPTATSSTKPTASPTTTPTTSPKPTQEPVETAKIELSSKSIMCNKGSVAKVTVTVTNGTLKSYTSNNTKLVTLKESDVQPNCIGCKSIDISCNDVGTAIITLEAKDGTKVTGTVTIKPLTEIAFTAKNIECKKGETTSVVINAGESTIKSTTSSNTSVASIKESIDQPNCEGCKSIDISCNAVGTSTLTAVSSNGTQAESTVTVKERTIQIDMWTGEMNPTEATVKVGETVQVTAKQTGTIQVKTLATYTSSDTSIATVDSTGKVTGVKAGTAVITGKFGNYTAGTTTITVTAGTVQQVWTGEMTPTEATVKIGETTKVEAKQTGTLIVKTLPTYTSSNTSVATVDNNGNVKGIKAGTAIITGKFGNYTAGTTTITVKDAPALSISAKSITCNEGDKKTITASGVKSYKSNNTAIAKIYPIDDGKPDYQVECIKEGTTTITFTSNSGETKSVSISVSKKGYAATPYCEFGTLNYNGGTPGCYVQNCKPNTCTLHDDCNASYGTTCPVEKVKQSCTSYNCSKEEEADVQYKTISIVEYCLKKCNPKRVVSTGDRISGKNILCRCEDQESVISSTYNCNDFKPSNLTYSKETTKTDSSFSCKYYNMKNGPTYSVYPGAVATYTGNGYTCKCAHSQNLVCPVDEEPNCRDKTYYDNGDKCGYTECTHLTDDVHLKYKCPNGGTLDETTKMCK